MCHSPQALPASLWFGSVGPWNLRPRHLRTSPNWEAPEMLVGDCCEIDNRSSSHHICAKAQDVWTLGCLAYWAVTGKKAFCSGTLALPRRLHAIREQHQIWVRPPARHAYSQAAQPPSLSHAFAACQTSWCHVKGAGQAAVPACTPLGVILTLLVDMPISRREAALICCAVTKHSFRQLQQLKAVF